MHTIAVYYRKQCIASVHCLSALPQCIASVHYHKQVVPPTYIIQTYNC